MRSTGFCRASSKIFPWATCLAFSWVMFGCGSARQEASLDPIDQEIANQVEDPNKNADEDAEVLRLLGITPKESEAEEPPANVVSKNQIMTPPNEELDELKGELDKKDREITLLRTQLTEKESQISDLATQLENRNRRPQIPKVAASTSASGFQARYDLGIQTFNDRKYQEAISIFSELLSSDSENSLSDNCQYWIGECYYGLQNYQQAITEFEKVFLFPNSNKSDDAQLKLGVCYFRLGDKQQARAEFDRLIANYPQSEYKSTAERYLAKL